MENPFKTVTLEKQSDATSERGTIIEMFVKEINKERLGTKWKPLTKIGIKRLAMDINRHPLLKTKDQLLEFYSLCKDAQSRPKGSFSGKCYGTVRPKVVE